MLARIFHAPAVDGEEEAGVVGDGSDERIGADHPLTPIRG